VTALHSQAAKVIAPIDRIPQGPSSAGRVGAEVRDSPDTLSTDDVALVVVPLSGGCNPGCQDSCRTVARMRVETPF
jgi:hypothetical protein